ncbi:MAG: type II toxin-antitoxin system RelE/ParE family toxin [Actinomycetaceae bacterium]|nr:type II toxin-antitoxin system RelE/ParE family toxin [Actinomycetaceae bacterium]
MNNYSVFVTSQARDHLHNIFRYISIELREVGIAKKLLAQLKKRDSWAALYAKARKIGRGRTLAHCGISPDARKNYYIYFWVDDKNKKVFIVAVIYVRRNQILQLEELKFTD